MIEHLRLWASQAFSTVDSVILATCGPSGPKVSRVQSSARETILVVRVPTLSDHLFNLEHQNMVAVLTPAWQLYGCASVQERGAGILPENTQANWQVMVEISPIRLQVLSEDELSVIETIDF